MKKLDVSINYLFHSGFAVETRNHFLVFDYYMDTVDKGDKSLQNGAIGHSDILSHKDIVVFSSHSHYDHFNPVILSWSQINPEIKYILSDDITVNEPANKIYKVSPYKEFKVNDLYIKTYGSTDMGVSFLVKTDGVKIFHAGDLNWWYWLDDPAGEIEKATAWFEHEMSMINDMDIDIAFFPVDPRLNEKYYIGAEYFMEKLRPKYLIPMHFGEHCEITSKLKKQLMNSPSEILEITHRGQEIIL